MDELKNVDLLDPFGTCKLNVGGIHVCDNVGNSKGIVKILLIVWALSVVFFADVFDMVFWAFGWIPVVGDILGNVVVGNIIDLIAGFTLFFLLGPISLLGITEFADILGFIPVIGDIISLLEWLPAWMFVIVAYAILSFVNQAKKGKPITGSVAQPNFLL